MVETDLNRNFETWVKQVEEGYARMWPPGSTVKVSASGQPPCPLCAIYDERRRIVTKLHHEDDTCIIVDCLSHPGTPMAVLKKHRGKPTGRELGHMRSVAAKLFGRDIKFRGPRTILSHFHEHVER